MLKLLSTVIITLLVTGCVGSPKEAPKGSALTPSTLEDLTGIWELSHETDELYLRISKEGDFVWYDYRGDSFDMGENCYRVSVFKMESLGEGDYNLTSDTEHDFTTSLFNVDQGILSISGLYGNEGYTKSILLVSDFSPLCGDS